jgi:hypothetical protein
VDTDIDYDTQYLIDAQELAQKAWNRDYRRKTCGRWSRVPNPANGQKDARRQICKDFRNCPDCQIRRIEEYRVRLLNEESWGEQEGKQMFCVLFDISEENVVERFTRKLPKQKAYYLRCPMIDDRTIAVFYAWKEPLYENSFLVTHDMVQSDQWLKPYIISPEDRKITGELGRRKENKKIKVESDNQDIEYVGTKAYDAEQMDDPAVNAIFYETRQEIVDEKVYDTVAEAMFAWLSLFESRCAEMGVTLHVSHHEKRRVDRNRVEWVRLSCSERISSIKNDYDHTEYVRNRNLHVTNSQYANEFDDPIPF